LFHKFLNPLVERLLLGLEKRKEEKKRGKKQKTKTPNKERQGGERGLRSQSWLSWLSFHSFSEQASRLLLVFPFNGFSRLDTHKVNRHQMDRMNGAHIFIGFCVHTK
jgi:hypothetical protein